MENKKENMAEPKEWFVIIPSRKLEICFSSELDFKE